MIHPAASLLPKQMQALWTHSNIYLYNIRPSCSWHVSRIKCWLTGSDNRQSVLWYPQYRCNRLLQQQTLLLPWITSLLCCKSACSLESTTINDSGDSHLAEIKQVHRIFGFIQLRQGMLLGWRWMVSVWPAQDRIYLTLTAGQLS